MALVSSSDFTNGSLCCSLYTKSLTGIGTDLVFNVGPESEIVHAHSLIVTEVSAVFKAMLNGSWDHNQKKTEDGRVIVDLPVDDTEDFKTLIKLMYGFSTFKPDDFNLIFPVYRMADKYEAPEILEVLSGYLTLLARNKLTISNVVEIYLISKEHGIRELEAAARRYVFKNIKGLWKSNSLLDLDEEALAHILAKDTLFVLDAATTKLKCVGDCCKPRCNNSNCARTNYGSQNEQMILRKVLEWIKHKKEKATEDQASVSRILSHVRVCQMTSNDFMQAMKDAKALLTEEELGKLLTARLTSTHDGVSPFTNVEPSFRKLTDVWDYGTCTHASYQEFYKVNGFYVCRNKHEEPLKQDTKCTKCLIKTSRH